MDEILLGVNDVIEVCDVNVLLIEDLIWLFKECMRFGEAREIEARLESEGFVRADRDVFCVMLV